MGGGGILSEWVFDGGVFAREVDEGEVNSQNA